MKNPLHCLALLIPPYFPGRIYLTSCGCLVCSDCGPRLLQGGQCGLCKAHKVAAKPIGRSLPPEHLNLFRPHSEQESLQSRARKDKFRNKHFSRGMKLHSKLEKVYKEDLRKKEDEMKKDEEEIRNFERLFEETKKKIKLLEEEIRKLEEKVRRASEEAVGGGRKKKESHPKPDGEGSSPSLHFLSF